MVLTVAGGTVLHFCCVGVSKSANTLASILNEFIGTYDCHFLSMIVHGHIWVDAGCNRYTPGVLHTKKQLQILLNGIVCTSNS